MSAVTYLVILNATRRFKDGLSEERAFYKTVVPVEEGATREDLLTFCQTTLDNEYFRKKYGELIDYRGTATINFWYCEPNQLG
jgi:hypothetical protein